MKIINRVFDKELLAIFPNARPSNEFERKLVDDLFDHITAEGFGKYLEGVLEDRNAKE